MAEDELYVPKLTKEQEKLLASITGGDDLLRMLSGEREVIKGKTIDDVVAAVDQVRKAVVAGRERSYAGLYYNSGLRTIATATAANTTAPEPPTANYPNREHIHEQLKRTAHITVTNEGQGEIYMRVTSNGISWSSEELKIDFADQIVVNDAYDIALRTTLANTQYRAQEYSIYSAKIVKYRSGNPYVNRATVPVAGVPITLDINAAIGSNAHTGTVSNLSAAANLFVELSSNGTTFATAIQLGPSLSLDLEGEDVDTIRLDASANNTPYQVIGH